MPEMSKIAQDKSRLQVHTRIAAKAAMSSSMRGIRNIQLDDGCSRTQNSFNPCRAANVKKVAFAGTCWDETQDGIWNEDGSRQAWKNHEKPNRHQPFCLPSSCILSNEVAEPNLEVALVAFWIFLAALMNGARPYRAGTVHNCGQDCASHTT